MRPMSAARRKRDKGYGDAREQVVERSDGVCETVSGGRPTIEGCTGQVEQVHHIAGRLGPDPHALDNLLGVCASCHSWIGDNASAATALGFAASTHTAP